MKSAASNLLEYNLQFLYTNTAIETIQDCHLGTFGNYLWREIRQTGQTGHKEKTGQKGLSGQRGQAGHRGQRGQR